MAHAQPYSVVEQAEDVLIEETVYAIGCELHEAAGWLYEDHWLGCGERELAAELADYDRLYAQFRALEPAMMAAAKRQPQRRAAFMRELRGER